MPGPSLLPEGMRRWRVETADGSQTEVITVGDAAKLVGMSKVKFEQVIERGQVTICYDAKRRVRVLVDSLAKIVSEGR